MRHIWLRLMGLLLAVSGWQVMQADDFNPDLPPEPMTRYAVTVTADPLAGAASLTGAGKYAQGTKITVKQTTATDYRFDYWTLNGVQYTTSASFNYTVGDSVAVFTAHYTSTAAPEPEVKQVGISVSANPAEGGTVSGAGVYTTGEKACLTASARTAYGWSFDYWEKDGAFYSSAASVCYTVGTEPAEFTARFSYTEFDPTTPAEPVAKYRVFTSASPAAAATTTGDGAYGLGTKVTVKATPQNGYTFLHWTLNGRTYSDQASFTYTVGDSVAYFVAVCERTYAVSVQVNPTAGGTAKGAGTYIVGKEITVGVTQKVPYVFDYWILNGHRTDYPQQFTYMVGDSTAAFVAYMRDTTYVDDSFEPETPPEPLTYVTITATPPENYYFVSWNDGDTRNPRTVLASEAGNYTPIYAPVDFAVNVQETICSNEHYMLGTQRLTLSGIYKATLRSSLGSDSVVTLDLTVLPAYLFTTMDTIYDGGSVTFIDTVLTTGGIYRKRFQTMAGCDSIYQRQVVLISDSVTVSVFANPTKGGSVSGGGKYHKERYATLTAEPATGWHFVRWQDGVTEPSRQVFVTEESRYIAYFAINRYEVQFVDYDGTVLKKDSVNHGEAVTAPANPTRTGYTFTGWDKAFDNIIANLTVTARYHINRYEVKFVDYDGMVLKKDSVNHGEAVTAPANPTRTGYTFTGWDKAFDHITANLTIKAQYRIHRFEVKFVDYDGTVLKKDSINYCSAAIAPANPTRTGYTFVGWDKAFDNITEDLIVTAQYVEKQPEGTVTVNILVPTDCSMNITEGVWLCWWKAGSQTKQTIQMIQQDDRHYTVQFNPQGATYHFFILNADNADAVGVEKTATEENRTALTYCGEVFYNPNTSAYILLQDDECALQDHDYRPHDVSVEVESGIVTFRWQMSAPLTNYMILLYTQNGDAVSASHTIYGTSEPGKETVIHYTFNNTNEVRIVYWEIHYLIEGNYLSYGKQDGFVVPAQNDTPVFYPSNNYYSEARYMGNASGYSTGDWFLRLYDDDGNTFIGYFDVNTGYSNKIAGTYQVGTPYASVYKYDSDNSFKITGGTLEVTLIGDTVLAAYNVTLPLYEFKMTNLLIGDYTVSKTIHAAVLAYDYQYYQNGNSNYLITLQDTKQVPTAIDDTSNTTTIRPECTKVLLGGSLYILTPDGRMYDMRGNKVKGEN